MYVEVQGAGDGARALMNTSFFGELVAEHRRARPGADRARAARRAAFALGKPGRSLRDSAFGPRRGLGHGARKRNPRRIRGADHRSAHRLLRGAGGTLRARTARGSIRPSPPGRRTRPTPLRPKSTSPPSRAGRNCSAGSISRPAAPRRWCICANNCSTRSIAGRTSRRSMPISSTCSRRGSIADFWCCGGSTGRRRR